ncbi:MAG TPA: PIN domain-containing protein [Solirubrobacterales bacterium]|nr:PIN domain-containing protein [Solirubrobacterales bacterium]
MVLPDTSVWVDYSRRGLEGETAGMRELLDRGEIVTCGPVAAELLVGADGDVAEQMWGMLSSIPWVQLPTMSWREVGRLGHLLRQAGQALPLTDLAIAFAAARGGHLLWSLDSDFERIAPALDDLELYRD